MTYKYLFLFIFIFASNTSAFEFSGSVSAEAEYFLDDPLYESSGQEKHSYGLTFKPELYHEISDDLTFQLTPFLYVNKFDNKRNHFDLRELYFHSIRDSFEVSLGLKKIYWGVTESAHLVDIINQTDAAMGVDGEDKLGQPMAHLSIENDFALFDFFVMPYFRERTFRGPESRLRTEPYVFTDDPVYEDSREEKHIDYAVRFLKSIGDLDFAISYFDGTSRDPLFIFGLDDKLMPSLYPIYNQINQTGIEAQYILGDWLLKYESIYRRGFGDYDYTAITTGFEYTFYGVFGSKADIGVLSEYLFDDRKSKALTPFEDDLMGGFRIAFNDLGSSEFLGGVIQDLTTNTGSLFVESSRRFGNNLRISLELRTLHGVDKNDLLYDLRKDNHAFIEAAYYF